MSNTELINKQKSNITDIKRLALIGVLVALGLILHIIESLLPALAFVPGAKLGLANIITLMGMVLLGIKSGGVILFLRIFLASLLVGTFLTLPFYLSLTGGVFAFLVMAIALIFFSKWMSLIGVSILGALAHNLGQVLAAALVIGNWGVFYSYFPLLSIVAIPTGFFVGITARMSLNLVHGKF